MRQRSRILLAAFTTTLLLVFAVGTASARRFELNAQTWRIVHSNLIFEFGAFGIRCPVTFEGSFHSRTISKVSGGLIGFNTETAIGACVGATATVLRETLPWHVRYDHFTGNLPNITGIGLQLVGMRIKIKPTGNVECLFGSTESRPFAGTFKVEGNTITGYRVDETRTLPLEGFICSFAGNMKFIGEGTPTQRGSAEPIRVRLVQ